ncbi:hypothetical protein EYS14_14425 [Alteromonadaceae bacterium M269]|nr:hypothetical protein EYS14_14425 [Alteromonadaceae bacterium M269]
MILFMIASVLIFSLLAAFANGVQTIYLNNRDNPLSMITQSVPEEWESLILRQDQEEIVSQIHHLSPNIMLSPEITAGMIVTDQNSTSSQILIRGLTEQGRLVRRVELVDGRWFNEDKNELVVKQIVSQKNPNLGIGNKLTIGDGEWQIVGIFRSDEPQPINEVWGSFNRLKNSVSRGEYIQSYYMRDIPQQVREHLETVFSNELLEPVLVTTVDQYYGNTFIGFRLSFFLGWVLLSLVLVSMALSLGAKRKLLMNGLDSDCVSEQPRIRLRRWISACVFSCAVALVIGSVLFSGEAVNFQLPDNEITIYLDFTLGVALCSFVFSCLMGGVLRMDKGSNTQGASCSE